MKYTVIAATLAAAAAFTPLPQATADEDDARAINLRMPRFAAPKKGRAFSHSESSFPGTGSRPIDFNNDGRTEIVQTFSNYPGAGPNSPEPIIILGYDKESGTYRKQTSKYLDGAVPEQVHSRVAEVADFNNDGRADYFLGGTGYDTGPFLGEPDYFLLSRPGQKHIAIAAPPGDWGMTHAAASGDVTGDGIADVYAGMLCCSVRGPYFLHGQQGTAPVASDDSLNDTVKNRTKVFTAAGIVDVNNDGRKDLILGDFADDASAADIYFNDGTGKFLSATPDMILPTGLFGDADTTVNDLLATDVNTDGRQDLLLAEQSQSTGKGHAIQLMVAGESGFADESNTRLKSGSSFNANGQWMSKLFAVDFYGDGISDFISHRVCPGKLGDFTIWINDGSGYFTPKTDRLFAPDANSAFCHLTYPVDFNKDKRTDIVQVMPASGGKFQAILYRNKGPGTSGSPTKAQVVRQPVNDIVGIGERFHISASVRGTRPLRFQWFKDGVAIAGAKKPVLTIASATVDTAGAYKLRIRNAAGDRFTSEVTITVVP